jgi:hypothetical protein
MSLGFKRKQSNYNTRWTKNIAMFDDFQASPACISIREVLRWRWQWMISDINIDRE